MTPLDNFSADVCRATPHAAVPIRWERQTGQIMTRKYSRKSNSSMEFPIISSLQISFHIHVSGPSKHSANALHGKIPHLPWRTPRITGRNWKTTQNNSQHNTKQLSLRSPSWSLFHPNIPGDGSSLGTPCEFKKRRLPVLFCLVSNSYIVTSKHSYLSGRG